MREKRIFPRTSRQPHYAATPASRRRWTAALRLHQRLRLPSNCPATAHRPPTSSRRRIAVPVMHPLPPNPRAPPPRDGRAAREVGSGELVELVE